MSVSGITLCAKYCPQNISPAAFLAKNNNGKNNIINHERIWMIIGRVLFLEKIFITANITHYSYLMASIGSKFAAFLAGYHPKKIPVIVHTAKLNITLHV